MTIRGLLIFLLLACLPAHGADVFSPSFRAKVEQAFQAPTAEARIALLAESVHEGTDSEVARAVGVYFPHGLLATARKDGVCMAQVDALLDVIRAATQVGMAAHFEANPGVYRTRLVDTIGCVHAAYADGIPMAPPVEETRR